MKQYLKKYKGENIFITLFTIILSVFQLFNSLIHTFAFNSLLQGNLRKFINWYIVGAILWFIYLIGNYLLSISKTRTIGKMTTDIRVEYANSYSKSLNRYLEKNKGDHLSALNNDISLIETSGFQNLYNLISTLSLSLFSIITLLSFDYRIMLASIILAILITVIPNLFQNMLSQANQVYSEKNGVFLNKLEDYISGFADLYYASKARVFPDKIGDASEHFINDKINYVKSTGKASLFTNLISVISQIILFVLTGYLVYRGHVTAGVLTSVGSIAGNVFSSLSQFSSYILNIKSIQPIFEKLSLKETNPADSTVVKINQSSDSIQSINFREVSFKYNVKPVLDDLSISFEANKKYAIVGESGSGKSTLVRILLGQLRDYTGEILINNETDFSSINTNWLIDNISFINNNTYIFNDTLYNNITMWDNSIPLEKVTKIMEKLNLNDLVSNLHDSVDNNSLSEGQKQRIGIARALLQQKSIIVMDEATANLDGYNASIIEEGILSNPNLGYITITHHLKPEHRDEFDYILELT